jgi:putative DNA primase/helicase
MSGGTVERARGRWLEILPLLGVATRFLVNRHGPCPICGGRDRFRFDDKEGAGTYYCNQCGPGSGIILVQRINEWRFKTAADKVDEIIGTGQKPPEPATTKPKDDPNRRLQSVQRVLDQATDRAVVESYLASRGLTVFPEILGGHSRLPYFDEGRHLGQFPAVIAPVIGPDNSLQSAHRIYVGDLDPPKKLMPVVDTVTGAAARLFKPGETIGVAEGVETAIACFELFGVPTWAGITAGGLESFIPPAGVNDVVIFPDNDASFTGQRAAFNLASRLNKSGFGVRVEVPPETDTDWLNVLVDERPSSG